MGQTALKGVMFALPMIFALGFIAPVIAQGMAALEVSAPFGLERLPFALSLAGLWGLIATITGRWL